MGDHVGRGESHERLALLHHGAAVDQHLLDVALYPRMEADRLVAGKLALEPDSRVEALFDDWRHLDPGRAARALGRRSRRPRALGAAAGQDEQPWESVHATASCDFGGSASSGARDTGRTCLAANSA